MASLRYLTGACLTLAVVFSSVTAVFSSPVESTRWTMINVSPGIAQADCHLIEFPDGSRVLIDAGEGRDAPPGTALAFFQKRHITHIDLVVISHLHKDHYCRLVDFIKGGIKIDRVALNVPDPALAGSEGTWGYDLQDVISMLLFLRQQGVLYFTPKAGDRLMEVRLDSGQTAALDVVCLYDGVHTPIGKTEVNDTSIILRLSHGPTCALFTGDLNVRLGTYLATSSFDLSADILKVPHHGTEGAAPNEFFERVNPKVALVPSPKTLWWSLRSKRIRTFFLDHHIPTYVNGINGDVTVLMTDTGFTIQTQYPGP